MKKSEEVYFNLINRIDDSNLKTREFFNRIESKKLKLKDFEIPLSFIVVISFIVILLGGDFTLSHTGFFIKEPENIQETTSQAVQNNNPSPSNNQVNINPSANTLSIQPIVQPPLIITDPPPRFEGLSEKLSSTEIVQEFPKDTEVSLKFFTFTNGERVWQNEYTLKKSSATEGKPSTSDAEIIMHSKYVNRIYSEDFCNILKDANKNGDLAYTSDLNVIKLTWKFKSIVKYKDCLN